MASSCQLPGNPDLYGAGVRIGVYLQWVSSQIAVFLRLEGSTGLMESYLVFSTAIVIALFVLTFTTELHITEVVIMVYMFFGGLVCVQDNESHKVPPLRRLWHAVVGLLLWSIMTIYSAWFWLGGNKSDWFLSHSCGTSIFLLARIPPKSFNKVSKFFAAVSILYGYIACGSLCYLLGLIVYEVWKNPRRFEPVRVFRKYGAESSINAGIEQRDAWVEEQDERRNEERNEARSQRPFHRLIRAFVGSRAFAQPIALLYSLIGIELMLKWNGVTGVYTMRSVGQLIPFVIGLAGLLKVIYDAAREKLVSIHS